LRKYKFSLLCVAALIWVLVFSGQTLTTKPRLWFDESINIELARNFSLFGKLDISVSPGNFSGQQALLQNTGYPVTLPLALFFKIFGFGLVQARVYMLIWLAAALLMVIWLVRKIFGERYAAWSLLLIATFAPFYANGRCVMGEIPGFFFLILAVYWLWYRGGQGGGIFLGGIFLGLAAAAKPSIYLLALPVVALVILWHRQEWLKRCLAIFSGAALPILAWLVIAMPNLFLVSEWAKLAAFYKKPFGEISAGDNIMANLAIFWHHSTIIYFGALLAVMALAIFMRKDFFKQHKNFLIFTLAYCVLAFFYFLRSPGWLRYLIAGQLLLFLIIPYAWANILDKINFKKERLRKFLFSLILLSLTGLQLWHLLYRADLFTSNLSQTVLEFIKTQPENKTVGIINSPAIACLIDPARKIQILKMLGLPVLGVNPLALKAEQLPDIIIAGREEEEFKKYENIVREKYQLIKSIDSYNIYNLSL